MATGLSNKLTGQVGEFLVCAELGRRGMIATPFAGNVPQFDVVATGDHLVTVPIQVKASNSTSWQTDLRHWLDVEYDAQDLCHVGHRKKRLQSQKLIYIYVALDEDEGDRFFILPQTEVRDIIHKDYMRYMKPRDYRRSKNPASMHWGIKALQLECYEGNWELIRERLKQ